MATVFEPPPTWAEVVLIDEKTKKARFNPVWLKWFVDLIGVLNSSGIIAGAIPHNSLASIQGGTTNQYYHLTSANFTYLTGLAAGTVAITGTTITGTGVVQGAGLVSTAGLTIGSATLITTTVAFTNGAAAAAGTLLNAPAAGNPTKWIPVDDNGTIRYLPAW